MGPCRTRVGPKAASLLHSEKRETPNKAKAKELETSDDTDNYS